DGASSVARECLPVVVVELIAELDSISLPELERAIDGHVILRRVVVDLAEFQAHARFDLQLAFDVAEARRIGKIEEQGRPRATSTRLVWRAALDLLDAHRLQGFERALERLVTRERTAFAMNTSWQ